MKPVSWTEKINIPLSACVPESLVSRDGFSRPVPPQPAHLHTQAESGALLTRFIPSSAAASIYKTAIRHRGSPEFYRVTQMHTDGVRCRESAGTGLVNLKVVPNECCLGRSPWTN